MAKNQFKIEINAKPEYVWFALWDDYYYRLWTSVFCEGSYMVTDWKAGSTVHFLSPGGNGMFSKLTCNKPFEKMHFTHIGEIRNFEEQPITEEVKKWTGAYENYDLTDLGNSVLLTASLDLSDEHSQFFAEVFPKGLAMVKKSAEELQIVIKTEVAGTLEKVWDYWTKPEHIVKWNFASDDWHTTAATNDLKVGGKFMSRMEAKDGSFGFDFEGEYTEVKLHEKIAYKLADNRHIEVLFNPQDNKVCIEEKFHPETENSLELQKFGWQAILDNFKKYTES